MQRLILLRHGKAESVSDLGGDAERGLTDRGRRDCALMGRVLADAGFKPDLVLVSAARRTRETWEEMSPAFPSAEVEFDQALYLASAERLAHAIDANAEAAACLMIVGHNPGIHEIAAVCAGRSQGPDRERLMNAFPTACAAVFGKDADGGWVLEAMLEPKGHGGGVL
jgi:phosphohistidine phosphatase